MAYTNIEKRRETNRKAYHNNKHKEYNIERQKKLAKLWYEKNKKSCLLRARKNRLARIYNLSVEEYDSKLNAQNGKCAICSELPVNNKLLSVDHCHKTGKVRGLLCHKCNAALGMLREDINIFNSAISYLKQHWPVDDEDTLEEDASDTD